MRTLGFLLIVVGGVLAYLGYQGKVGQAFQAIKTGNVPQTFTNKPVTVNGKTVSEQGGGNTLE